MKSTFMKAKWLAAFLVLALAQGASGGAQEVELCAFMDPANPTDGQTVTITLELDGVPVYIAPNFEPLCMETAGGFVCYGEARRSAKGDARFGEGDPRGIAAPEAGNNAVAASSLIPLVTLGIPGSVAAAVMYGAFMIQGMIPGPMLMQEHPEIIYGLFVLLLMTDFIGAFVVALPFISVAQRIFKTLNYSLFFPGVVVCCVVGVYAEEFNVFNLRIFLALGFLGYIMRKMGMSIPPFILAFILGPILERNTRTALLMSRGDPMIFIKSPIAAVLLVLAIAALIWSLWRKTKGRVSAMAVPEEFKH